MSEKNKGAAHYTNYTLVVKPPVKLNYPVTKTPDYYYLNLDSK